MSDPFSEQAELDRLWQDASSVYEAVRGTNMDALGGHNRFVSAIAQEIISRRGLDSDPRVNDYRNLIRQTISRSVHGGIMDALITAASLSASRET